MPAYTRPLTLASVTLVLAALPKLLKFLSIDLLTWYAALGVAVYSATFIFFAVGATLAYKNARARKAAQKAKEASQSLD